MATAAHARPAVPEDSALIAELHALSAAKPKLVKSNVYAAPADEAVKVRSWKMDEFKYYDVPSPFPTLARGIFTVELPKEEGSEAQEYRIVARGYDKFFNIGEVPWTTWESLEEHTAAPYTLSLKSNGCIIFIAALTPTKLLVTSKHSVGSTPGEGISHAEAGEEWLRKYFERMGKTEEQLAARLWENNWTAIAELCDDSFEEHVLGYAPEVTGLHLHGLNSSTKAFHTLPQADVDAFAAEWGFIRTASLVLPTLAEVRSFTDSIGESGAWNGEPVEGFVVRTHVASTPGRAPYAPGATFFFKIKFDEPYMMYRDWREVTKTLLRLDEQARSGKGKGGTTGMSEKAVSRNKMKRAETQVYVRWVIGEIRREPGAFSEYGKNRGIIATRERFLAYLATEEGAALLEAAKAGNMPPPSADAAPSGPAVPFGKTIIVPVAIPGCGKTAVAVALAYIFGFGHTQSDDVRAKKPAPVFIKNVTGLLTKYDVVIADKNNHLRQHRAALRTATTGRTPAVRLLALNWALDALPPTEAHALCAQRIAARGANHQTLRATDADAVPVLWMFINKTEPLAEEEVDAVVEMRVGEGLEESVKRAVEGVCGVLGLPDPGEGKITEGVEKARGYAAPVQKEESTGGKGNAAKGNGKDAAAAADVADKKKKKKGPRYYALLPDVSLDALLAARVAEDPLYTHLVNEKRVAARPHVTLVHSKALAEPGAEGLWARCAALDAHGAGGGAAAAGGAGGAGGAVFRCALGSVLWDGRVMVVTVDDVSLEREGGAGGQAGAEFVSTLPADVRGRLHITVGTRDASIPAVEGKTLVEAWRAGKTAGIKELKLEGVSATARVAGLYS
ncbi:RNA ligase-domain-containing protein [Mycena rosella]|uniref:RNA ligase-domain-containing protein n=1 Tax=Mycena rosella TaxID=1033263 RepID=A0AAD7DS14_MYCRO|nr:RNA ligase-domain-containing protein [Mycena rosella]